MHPIYLPLCSVPVTSVDSPPLQVQLLPASCSFPLSLEGSRFSRCQAKGVLGPLEHSLGQTAAPGQAGLTGTGERALGATQGGSTARSAGVPSGQHTWEALMSVLRGVGQSGARLAGQASVTR